MLIQEVTDVIEAFCPLQYQENYDNAGLQVGDKQAEVTGILLTLDVTEEIVQEAIDRQCNLIIAHHPLIFSGLKRLAGNTFVERTIKKAIKNDIHIYAAHTNLDNMRNGVNAKIAEKLGLVNTSVLSMSKGTISKLYTYAPVDSADKVLNALFAAGAGTIGNYEECSYNINGLGSFKPGQNANPTIGQAGGERKWVNEIKIEVLVAPHNEKKVLKALKESHPYEEVAYELISLKNQNQDIGAGMIGTLPEPMDEMAFMNLLKEKMRTGCIRHTPLLNKKIERVAVCGGSGSFLLPDAIGAKADIFITADFKYHQFFDADNKIVIADIGHYESEQFTLEIFETLLKKKFLNFAILLSNLSTNPVKYFC